MIDESVVLKKFEGLFVCESTFTPKKGIDVKSEDHKEQIRELIKAIEDANKAGDKTVNKHIMGAVKILKAIIGENFVNVIEEVSLMINTISECMIDEDIEIIKELECLKNRIDNTRKEE